MYSTSFGKTILAYLPPRRTEEIVEATEYVALTPETITSPEALYEVLDVIAEQDYGIDDEENFEGLRCISAPVRNGKSVLGAISITGPSSRFTEDRLHGELSEYVKRAANVIVLNTKFARSSATDRSVASVSRRSFVSADATSAETYRVPSGRTSDRS